MAKVFDVESQEKVEHEGFYHWTKSRQLVMRWLQLFIYGLYLTRNIIVWAFSKHSSGLTIITNVIVSVFQVVPYLGCIGSWYVPRLKKFQASIQYFIISGSTLAMGIELLMRSLNGPCQSLNIDHIWSCNPAHAWHSLPMDSLIILIMTPWVFICLFNVTHTLTILTSAFIMILFLLLSILLTDSFESSYAIVFGSLICLVGMAGFFLQSIDETDYKNLNLKFPTVKVNNSSAVDSVLNMRIDTSSITKLKPTGTNNSQKSTTTRSSHSSDNSGKSTSRDSSQKTSSQRLLARIGFKFSRFFSKKEDPQLERLTQESIMNEFKFMIANNAHDLKTPLAAILSGIELVTQVSLDMESKICSHEKFFQGPLENLKFLLRDDVRALQVASKSMATTNTFMLMSINRTIDYSKAKSGIVLSPRHELVHVGQLIQYCVDCVQDLDPSANISVLDIHKLADMTVQTDRQWLHDNILCLISNAVKYSAKGDLVTVSIQLRPRNVLMSTSSDDQNDCLVPSYSLSIDETNQRSNTRSGSGKTELVVLSQQMSSSDLGGSARSIPLSSPDKSKARTTTKAQDMMVYIEVVDAGVTPVDESTIDSLFESADSSNAKPSGGLGLGLHCIALRMKSLGGCYGYSPRQHGPGSTFWFAFPCLQSTTPKVKFEFHDTKQLTKVIAPLGDHLKSSSTESNNGVNEDITIQRLPSNFANSSQIPPLMRVLVVDDSPLVLKVSSSLLKRKGFYVETANNGDAALLKIENSRLPFQIVLMDMQMPVSDGIEAIQRIRQHESILSAAHRSNWRRTTRKEPSIWNGDGSGSNSVASISISESVSLSQAPKLPKICIIGVSASSDNKTMEQAFAAGADLFVAKPLTAESLNQVTKYLSTRNQGGVTSPTPSANIVIGTESSAHADVTIGASSGVSYAEVVDALSSPASFVSSAPASSSSISVPVFGSESVQTSVVAPALPSSTEMLITTNQRKGISYASESSADESGPDAIRRLYSAEGAYIIT